MESLRLGKDLEGPASSTEGVFQKMPEDSGTIVTYLAFLMIKHNLLSVFSNLNCSLILIVELSLGSLTVLLFEGLNGEEPWTCPQTSMAVGAYLSGQSPCQVLRAP